MPEEQIGVENPWHRVRDAAMKYVGIGWFLTQVSAVLGDQLGWPPRIGDYLVIALGVGFVVTMAVAILFSRRPRPPGKRAGGLILAGLAALAGVTIWVSTGGQPEFQASVAGFVQESRGLLSTSSDLDAYLVVHPQQPLVPTSLRVRRGQSVTVRAEGHVNIALARLVEAVEAGDEVAYEWVGPAGEIDSTGQPILRPDRARAGREGCLVHREFPYGALLLVLSRTDRLTPGAVRDLAAGREVFSVGDGLTLTAASDGFLTLGLNDVYLDRRECDPEAFDVGTAASSFFRDNIGFFSVSVEIR